LLCCCCSVAVCLSGSRGSTVSTWPLARASNTLHENTADTQLSSAGCAANSTTRLPFRVLRRRDILLYEGLCRTNKRQNVACAHPDGCAAMARGAPDPLSQSSRPRLVPASSKGKCMALTAAQQLLSSTKYAAVC
jgi:hypothetical protein